MALPLTVTVIALGDNHVPTWLVARATKGGNGVKKGELYHPLAVNHKGEIAVSSIANAAELVTGPQGHWHKMLDFEWVENSAAKPEGSANDN